MKTRQRLMFDERKFMPVMVDNIRLDGSFSGYASIFGEVDQGKDAVAKGAFRNSLQSRKPNSIRMLYQHNPDEPIGVWKKIKEDEKGLYVEGQITRGVRKSEEVLELMRAGALDGLSIGFKTRRARTDPATKIRWILAADLWEISIVTFPLLESARISSVKSGDQRQKYSIRQFERWLTRDAGLSRSEAKTVITDGFAHLACKRDAAKPETVAEKIRSMTQTLKTGTIK
ncbi:MAG: HK97 family phage prohead protease [Pseudomonadota bacterium]